MRTLAVLGVAVLLSACQQEPRAVGAAAPAAEVQVEASRFLGGWSGRWGDCLDGKLTVASVEPSGAMSGIYAFGNCAEWRITAGSAPVRGRIEAGTLTLERFPNGARVIYRMQGDGSLAGTYTLGSNVTQGVFRKE